MSARPTPRVTKMSSALAILPEPYRPPAGCVAHVEQVDLPAHELLDPPTSNFILCLVRTGEAKASFGFGERRWSGQLLPGMFTPVTPPNVAGEIRLAAPQKHLVITFSSNMVAAVLGGSGEDLGSVHDRPFRDPLLSQICLSLRGATAAAESHASLFREYAVAVLIAGLANRNPASPRWSRENRSLSSREWSLVTAYIGDQLDGDLSLAALARVVDMGQHAFIRAFTAASGHSPHQFILRKRVASARTLLSETSLSLAEVALKVGFADQAHMTTTFSRLTGETPGRVRRR